VYAIPLNFYAITTMVVLFVIIFTGKDFGPMKHAEHEAEQEESSCVVQTFQTGGSIKAMFYPIAVMLLSVPISLFITGKGDVLAGSGSSAIFYSVLVTLIFIAVYYSLKKIMNLETYFTQLKQGAGDMVGIGFILLLAFALGDVTVKLNTGPYLASLVEGNISAVYIAAIIFLVSSLMAFSTGTSWGTFSIMMPIALPMAAVLDANIPLVIAAVISGGVFGDHCSPISDTTIISAMAADCETIEHGRTQLPYALFSGFLSLILFVIFGMIL
jgi:Na+/H+ antiporter NhaC